MSSENPSNKLFLQNNLRNLTDTRFSLNSHFSRTDKKKKKPNWMHFGQLHAALQSKCYC